MASEESVGGGGGERERGVPLPGGGVARTLGEAWEGVKEQLYRGRRGRVSDVELERDWMIWVTGVESGMRLVYEMGRGRGGEEQAEAMRALYGELGELATRKNVMATRAALAMARERRRNGR